MQYTCQYVSEDRIEMLAYVFKYESLGALLYSAHEHGYKDVERAVLCLKLGFVELP